MDIIKPQLCGGAFFTLIVKSKTLVADAHEKEKGVSYENSDDDILRELIRVFYPEYEIHNKGSFHTMTNNYKKCDYEWPKKIPFANDDEMMKLKEKEVSLETVKRMQDFLKTYVKGYEISWLINAVTELIEKADNLQGNEEWVVAPGCKVSSGDIRRKKQIYVDWYLAGVWQYIITNVRRNRIGKESYPFWFQKDSNEDEYAFTSNIGNNLPLQFEVLWDTQMINDNEVENITEPQAIENIEKEEESPKTSHDIITEQMCKSAQVVADVLEAYFDNVANTITQRNQAAEAPERIDVLYESSMMKGKLWQRIKSGDIKPLQYSNAKEINQYAMNEYYEFSESCSLKTRYIDGAKMVEVKIPSQGFDIIGYTTGSNWKSESAKNRAIKHGTHIFKGIFKVEAVEEDSISVQYLYLGEEV